MSNIYTRRIFNRQLGTVTASLMVAPLIGCETKVPTSISKHKKLGVALVGLGYYSKDLLAPALRLTEHCELRGIVTGSPEKIPIWQQSYNIPDANVYNYDNMHQIANNDDIDVIYVVVPTGLHLKYVAIAANAGKHVWCEKPMGLNVGECQQIINVCNINKVKLSIGYRVQHDPNMKEIITITKSSPFGPIKSASAAAGYAGGAPSIWRGSKKLGGGALYDMGVYTINGLRHGLGMEPVAVTKARHIIDHPEWFTEVDETTEYTLEFPDNVMAEGKTSVTRNYNRLEIQCEKGSYYLDPMQSYNGLNGGRSDGQKFFHPVENQQATQMDADALAIINNTEVLVPGIDGLRDIAIVNAILKSVETGKRVEI